MSPNKLILARIIIAVGYLAFCLPLGNTALPLSFAAEPGSPPNAQAAETSRISGSDPRAMQVEFADGSQLRLMLADVNIEIETPHGKLAVPAVHVRRLEFTPRLTPQAAAKLAEQLPKIGSTNVSERETAIKEIQALGESAIPALQQAAQNAESEAAAHAADLLAQLQKQLPPGRRILPYDLLETGDSRIFGHVTTPELKVITAQFGPLAMRVADVRSIRSLALVLASLELNSDHDPELKNALPDPGNLSSFSGQIGKTLAFQVTGTMDGSLWGTDEYTTDSDLSTAAVHSGAVEAGKSGVVRVKIIDPPAAFAGSLRNGVTSYEYGSYPTAYQFIKKKDASK